MKLLTAYSRVAIPWESECPQCTQQVKDWKVEWLEESEQKEVLSEQANIDCPLCRQPVAFSKFIPLLPPKESRPLYTRREDKANQAAMLEGYPSLERFLQDEFQAEQYKDYWQKEGAIS